MKRDELKARMEFCRRDAEAEASALKDSQFVLDRLGAFYGGLDLTERELADRVLSEWALSPDDGLRFDALALIDKFRVHGAAPSLRELARLLKARSTPSAPYELAKVMRILQALQAAPE